MWIVALFVGIVTVFAVFLYHVKKTQTYWKDRNIPFVPSSNIFTNQLLDTASYDHPFCFKLQEWTKQYGSTYGIFSGIIPELVISDPAMAHEMLNKKFENFYGRRSTPLLRSFEKNKRAHLLIARGARWQRLRAITSPIFTTSKLRRVLPIVDDSAKHTVDFLDKAYENGKAFSVLPYLHEYTMDVICRIAMGQKGSQQFKNPNVELVINVFKAIGATPFELLAFVMPRLTWVFLPVFAIHSLITQSAFHKVLSNLTKVVNNRIKEKKSGKIETQDLPDFIDFFLDSVDENVTDGEFTKNKSKVVKRVMPEEIVGQCFAFLLAGFDTTANTLTTIFWYLAKHPDIQEKVLDEINEVCDTSEITYEQLGQLKYIDALSKEVLRLCPIATPAIARECMESTTLGEIPVEKGTNVWIDLVTLNRNKDIWGEDADEFHPERFFNVSVEMQNAMLNFGSGPRVCIGMKLAYMEKKLALIHILRKYKIVATAETEKKLEIIGRIVQNPKSVTIKLELR